MSGKHTKGRGEVKPQPSLEDAEEARFSKARVTRRAALITGMGVASGVLLGRKFAGESSGPPRDEGSRPRRQGSSTAAGPRAINARDFGVREDVADVSGALNALIEANPGATIMLPAGATYTTRADHGRPSTGHGGGIVLNRPGTTLDLRGATLSMQPSSSRHYQIIDVTASECRLIGGTVVGDVTRHAGTTGEWGHGVSIGGGADRFQAQQVRVLRCWGDGFYIWEDPSDVELLSCVGDDNRRQGVSIIHATRPTITGGQYVNTGTTAFTGPGAGIDIEPDPHAARDVRDALIHRVTLTGNQGPGLRVTSNGRTITATAVNVTAMRNGGAHADSGLEVLGPQNSTRLIACTSTDGSGSGFLIESDGTMAERCRGGRNARNGFRVEHAAAARLLDCEALENGHAGYLVGPEAVAVRLEDCAAEANGQESTDTYPQFDVYGDQVALLRCASSAGDRANKPSYGYVIRSGGSGSLVDCSVRGTFPSGDFLNKSGSASADPTPGG